MSQPPMQPNYQSTQLAKAPPQALWGMVLSILSFVVCSIFASIPGVILSHIALGKINKSPTPMDGKGMALAGLIVGYINIAIAVLLIPLMILILVPTLSRAREAAENAVSANNLREIGQAMAVYSNQYRGAAPPDLQTLVKSTNLDPEVLVHPADDTGGPSYEMLIPPFADLYGFLSDTALVAEKEDFNENGKQALYGDYSVRDYPLPSRGADTSRR